jgi:glycerophosphoryl diester phosphodiesterase
MSRMAERIGHRGAAGHAPENTLVSMRLALELGVDGVEFDIHRTKDGVLVVIHDPTVNRTTNGVGAVGELKLAELRQLDAGAWKGTEFAGERIPTLAELVEVVPAPYRLFLEMKAGDDVYPGIEAQVAQFLQERDLVGRTNISSFDHFVLRRMRQLLPTVETGMLYSGRPIDPVAMARACGANAIHANWHWVSTAMVAEAHAAGMRVHVWTPNAKEAIAHCYTLGVDAIITDYPERCEDPATR